MKIAIIGGSGFVGTELIARLTTTGSDHLINIDKAESKSYPSITYYGNVLDQSALNALLRGVDLVVLLAAEHRDDVTPVSKYYDVNVQGMKNTLNAMEINGIKRIVFTSSVAVYGLDKPNPNEDSLPDPFNHYGKSKLQAEKVLEKWYAEHADWNINIIRPTVIFGEGNRGNVYNLLRQVASGRFMMIGKGNNEKSMSYIGNITAFINFLITSKTEGYNIFNYVDKADLSTNDLVYYTGEILGKKIPTVRIPYWMGLLAGHGFDVLAFILRRKMAVSAVRVKKFCAVTQYDSTKAMTSGFIPPFTLKDGLERMLKKEFSVTAR